MMTTKQSMFLAFALTVLSRLLFHYLTGFTYDDAFITFRYAENIAAGNGFVYNVGERVLGTTTPLFTLILAALVRLGIPVETAALLISLPASGLTAVVLYRWAKSLDYEPFAFIPVIIYILFTRLLATDSAGMETALFTLLVTVSLYFQYRMRVVEAMSLAALSAVTRPEGFLVLAILFAWDIFQHRRNLLINSIVAVLVVLPWIIFAYGYFGSPIPNSIHGKLALYSRFGTLSPWNNISFLLGWQNPFGIFLTIGSLIGCWWLWKKHRLGWPELIWVAAMLGFLTISRTHLFVWYAVPIYPVLIIWTTALFPAAYQRFAWLRRYSQVTVPTIVIGLTIVMLAANYIPVQNYQSYQKTLTTVHRAIGIYLRDHAKKGDVVAAEDIGYLGYYSGLKIIDRDGLISPEAAPYNETGNYFGLISDHNPQWVLGSTVGDNNNFLENHEFLNHYQFVKGFLQSDGCEYRLYSRKNKS